MKALSYKKGLPLYYSVLLVVFFLIMRPEVSYPQNYRIVLMALVFIPVFLKQELFPFVMLCFYGVSSMSFAPILPSASVYYLVVAVVFFSLNRKKSNLFFYALIISTYYLLVSLIYGDSLDFIIYFIIGVMVADSVKDKQGLMNLFFAFVIISIFLSLLYVFNMDSFGTQYGKKEIGLESSYWMNPNAFSAVVGAGGVLAVAYLTQAIKLKRDSILTITSIAAILLSFVTITLNASRGAMFSLVIPSLLMLLFSKTKFWIKSLMVIMGGGFLIWMLQNNMFELLSYRLQEETFDSAGGRTFIWMNKMSSFFNDISLGKFLFGLGYNGCVNLGAIALSTHNDIITSFIGFGIIGFVLFVYYVFIFPFQSSPKNNRRITTVLLLFLFLESSVLEPFFRGHLVIMMFYLFILKYASLVVEEQ